MCLCTCIISSLIFLFWRLDTAANLTHYYLKQFLTRTVWWAIPVIWLPVVCWAISKSIQMGVWLPHIAFLVVCGIFLWTLIEYSLHRFLFHIDTKSYWLVIILISLSLSLSLSLSHVCSCRHLKFCMIF